jgi:hypothetical protein
VIGAADEIRPLYRAMLILGAVAVVILALGLFQFFAFEPQGQHSGITVKVVGVFHYDPRTKETSGPDRAKFSATEDFAAVVDWSAVPGTAVVGAIWLNSLGQTVGRVGPKPGSQLTDADRIVPVKVPAGLTRNIPGEYILVVERFKGGQPVEVLARRFVLVRRTA